MHASSQTRLLSMHVSRVTQLPKHYELVRTLTLLAASFAVCKKFILRLDTTELLIYTRGESTSGVKRLVGAKRPGGGGGGNVLGAKRLGEEMVCG